MKDSLKTRRKGLYLVTTMICGFTSKPASSALFINSFSRALTYIILPNQQKAKLRNKIAHVITGGSKGVEHYNQSVAVNLVSKQNTTNTIKMSPGRIMRHFYRNLKIYWQWKTQTRFCNLLKMLQNKSQRNFETHLIENVDNLHKILSFLGFFWSYDFDLLCLTNFVILTHLPHLECCLKM